MRYPPQDPQNTAQDEYQIWPPNPGPGPGSSPDATRIEQQTLLDSRLHELLRGQGRNIEGLDPQELIKMLIERGLGAPLTR